MILPTLCWTSNGCAKINLLLQKSLKFFWQNEIYCCQMFPIILYEHITWSPVPAKWKTTGLCFSSHHFLGTKNWNFARFVSSGNISGRECTNGDMKLQEIFLSQNILFPNKQQGDILLPAFYYTMRLKIIFLWVKTKE